MGIGLVESLSAASTEHAKTEEYPNWNGYMDRYLQGGSTAVTAATAATTAIAAATAGSSLAASAPRKPHQRPFLDRCIRSVLTVYPTMDEVMSHVEFRNVLGSKICMEKYDVRSA